MKNVKMQENRKSLSEIIKLVCIHVKIKWNNRKKPNYKFINNKFIDLNKNSVFLQCVYKSKGV